MKKELLKKLQLEFKRSDLVDELVKAELEGKFIFSDESLSRAARETGVRAIDRQEIEFKKELANDKKFNNLQCIIKATIQDLQDKEGEERNECTELLLSFIDLRDHHQESIRSKYNFEDITYKRQLQ